MAGKALHDPDSHTDAHRSLAGMADELETAVSRLKGGSLGDPSHGIGSDTVAAKLKQSVVGAVDRALRDASSVKELLATVAENVGTQARNWQETESGVHGRISSIQVTRSAPSLPVAGATSTGSYSAARPTSRKSEEINRVLNGV